MKKGVKKSVFLLIILIQFLAIISASFSLENYSIRENYASYDYIEGTINISFKDELANSNINTNIGDSIELIELLKINNIKYSCVPKDCTKGYSISGDGETTKTFSMTENEEKLIGLKFTGNIISINSINFTIQSNAQKSCNNQLRIDILNDNKIDTGNNKISTETCENLKRYGCFNNSATTEKFIIKKAPFCQKINLNESPGFDIGAWVQKEGSKINLKMAIYDIDGNEIPNAKCNLPDATTEGSEVNCSINYLTTKAKEHYVCISGDVDSGLYKIKGNSNPSKFCGFYGIPTQTEDSSYAIFARAKKFDSMTNVKIENTLSEDNFNEIASNYINEKYNNECTNGCIVPIKLISRENQQITLSGLRARYEKTGGEVIDENFYILEESDARITSEQQNINLEKANFIVSKTEELGDKTFILKLNNINIFSKQISIKNISTIIDLKPRIAVAAYSTSFEANARTGENANITRYEWDFGDENKKTTDKNKIEYTYNSIGTYYLKLTIIDSTSYQTSKIFKINVSSPKNAINQTIKSKFNEISILKSELNEFPASYKLLISKTLKLNDSEDKLRKIEKNYSSLKKDEDYINLMKEINLIKIPNNLFTSEIYKPSAFIPKEEDINPETLKEITKEDYDSNDERKYKDGIILWFDENINAKLKYEEISGTYTNEEKILKIFELDLNNKLKEDYYVAIKKLENFESDKKFDETENYYYLKVSSNQKIAFSTTEDVDFSTLELFISPALSELGVTLPSQTCNKNNKCEAGENKENCSDCQTSTQWIIIIISLIAVIGIIIYFILREWYKRKYEIHLFKNKNDLYNMLTYINNSMKQGNEDSKTMNNLKRAGWSSEQISFAMKKYKGKKTGMP